MSNQWRFGVLLLLLVFGASACSEPDETSVLVRPKATASPSGQQQGTGSGLTGGVSGPTTTEPVVQYVRLDESTLSLNVPPAAGLVSAGLLSTASLNARAVLTDGQPDPSGVDWQIQDPSRLAVDTQGVISVRADASTGVTTLTAVSRRNPTLKAQVTVTVTRDGILEVQGVAAGSGYVRANVTRNGYYVTNWILEDSPRHRLPAGSGYDVQLQRVSGSETSVIKDFTDLAVQPNAVTVATSSP